MVYQTRTNCTLICKRKYLFVENTAKKLANFEVDLTLFPNISGCLEVLLWELSNGYDACLCTKFVLLQLSDR